MKFSIKDFFSKCDQIRRKLRIWSYLLNKSLMENFIFCAVTGRVDRNVNTLAIVKISPICKRLDDKKSMLFTHFYLM